MFGNELVVVGGGGESLLPLWNFVLLLSWNDYDVIRAILACDCMYGKAMQVDTEWIQKV